SSAGATCRFLTERETQSEIRQRAVRTIEQIGREMPEPAESTLIITAGSQKHGTRGKIGANRPEPAKGSSQSEA
ncbi:hypothetical protein KI387_000837, partial [Taxus chinensis]